MKALEIHRFRRSKPTFRRFQGDGLGTGSLNGLPFSSFVDSKRFPLHTKILCKLWMHSEGMISLGPELRMLALIRSSGVVLNRLLPCMR